ncbi:sucrose-6-phosphate hydrolase [Saccharibacillus sp. O16]|nr:sucrose-6-phosphate hydrolase [Saccharibacillus sp. O16]
MTSSLNPHAAELARAEASLTEARQHAAQDPWRLRYHVAAPAYWINDPNGFCFYKGEYHLFYQHHPYSPEWGPMYWGHVKSRDLAHWESLPIALAPSEAYDADGCFSGSAIEKDGQLWLMYTGNRWTGPDRDHDLLQVQALAFSEDGVHFEKYAGNPVLSAAPQGDIHPFHFRDPKVWIHEGVYYCVLGSQTKDRRSGQVLLYRSENLTDWSFVSVMAGGQEDRDILGYMWECPDLFPLGGQELLVCSPQGMAPLGDLYHNLHQSGAFVGKLDYESGRFTHGELMLLDHGFDFYAPQTVLDDQGRRIVIAWMAMWEDRMPEQKRGWAGAMTLPRELTLENGRLFSRPVPELAQLRGEEIRYANEALGLPPAGSSDEAASSAVAGDAADAGGATGTGLVGAAADQPEGAAVARHGRAFPGIYGDCLELEVEFDAGTASRFGLALRANEARGEETVLAYDAVEGKLTLDRERSGAGSGGVRRTDLALQQSRLKLRVFLDRSSVEAFAQDGERVMSARIYPDAESTGIFFFAEGGVAKILSLRYWPLKDSGL